MIRVVLPIPLRVLARIEHDVELDVPGEDGPLTQRAVLDSLEAAYPVLGGTIRDRASGRRRAFVRFYVGEEDRSHDDPDAPLPEVVTRGEVPFVIVGAMAGG